MKQAFSAIFLLVIVVFVGQRLFPTRNIEPIGMDELSVEFEAGPGSELSRSMSEVAEGLQRTSELKNGSDISGSAAVDLNFTGDPDLVASCTEDRPGDLYYKEICLEKIQNSSSISPEEKKSYFGSELLATDCLKFQDSKKCRLYLLDCLDAVAKQDPGKDDMIVYLNIVSDPLDEEGPLYEDLAAKYKDNLVDQVE